MSLPDPSPAPHSSEGVTECLERWGRHDDLEELAPLVYDDLRRLAATRIVGRPHPRSAKEGGKLPRDDRSEAVMQRMCEGSSIAPGSYLRR